MEFPFFFTRLVKAALAVFLTITLVACEKKEHVFVTVHPEPTTHMWWLRAEYHPFDKTVRNIPVKTINKTWCKANEFKRNLLKNG